MKKLLIFIFLILSIFVLTHGHGGGEHKPEDPTPGIIDINPENAHEVINKNFNSLVEFYAPWCGHCKHLAPEMVTVGQAMISSKPQDVRVGKVNCDAHNGICSKYGVTGYPTIKFFPKGKPTPEDYNAGRTADDIINFLNIKANANLRVAKAPSFVLELTSDNFDKVVFESGKNALVEFYAPWCGHCKSLAPLYEIVAKAFANEPEVVIANVNADKYRELGQKYGVTGFPTLKFFKKGSKTPQDFQRGTESAMIDSVNSLAGTARDVSGKLNPTAGRITELDEIAKKFVQANKEEKKELLSKAEELSNGYDNLKKKSSSYYIKTMQKIESNSDYASKELERITRIINSASASASSLDEFQVKKNILSVF